MRNYQTYAELEFKAAGWLNDDGTFKDDMQKMMCEHVLKLLEVFADEGHSGSTAPYAVNLFKQLAMFEPLTPLTGEDWEWNDIGDGSFQNKRCSRVFKRVDRFDGQAYDITAIVFREADGWCYTNSGSAQPITFPYTPHTEYVDVPSSDESEVLQPS